MASHILSRLLPSANGTQSIYDAIREHDAALEESDNEDHAGIALDERNLDERFQDQEIDRLLQDAADSQMTAASDAAQPFSEVVAGRSSSRSKNIPKWNRRLSDRPPRIEEDDDVPESLLLEDDIEAQHHAMQHPQELPVPFHEPARTQSSVQWDTRRARRLLHEDTLDHDRSTIPKIGNALMFADPEEKALWMWANVSNLDSFLRDVYLYYLGKGFWSIQLQRLLGQLTFAFVITFSTFLLACVDYNAIPESKHLSEIVIPKCTKNMSGWSNLLIWFLSFSWIALAFYYITDIRRLWRLHQFYLYLLRISDKEVQTISWQEIVSRLMNLRDSNPTTALNNTPITRKYAGNQSIQRMDAHDIANRVMRRENYLIALFNKDVLNLTLPIPVLRERRWFSKTLEVWINRCVMDYVFNKHGQVSQLFLKDSHRKALIEALQRRFMIAGCLTIICAPFIVTYFLLLYFLKYFTEFRSNPSEIGSRAYTPLAEWKFREFNELYHLFQRRTNMSRPFASRYIDQFPKDKTIQLANFLALVAGAVAAVLGIASLLDPENFLSFEITRDRTVLFYISLFGGIWAVARGMVPGDDLVFDPEFAIKNVIDYTHYHPAHWKDQLHSDDVRGEFSALYQMKIVIFFEEMLSLLFAPFVLWFSLPDCSERIIDFFREFTIHVDGLGYVCSFAVFDFNKGTGQGIGGKKSGQGDDLRDDYYTTKDDKMLTSYYYFMDSYANNPKGGRFPNYMAGRRSFNPPPAFPGLAAPIATGVAGTQPARADRSRANGILVQSSLRSPVARASAAHMSPSPSLLLDPHHQPARSVLQKVPRHLAHSRQQSYGQRTGSMADAGETAPYQHVTSSTILEEDSHLGDSWRTGRAGDADGEDEMDEEDTAGAGGVAGVLGMISKFTQGQVTGANM